MAVTNTRMRGGRRKHGIVTAILPKANRGHGSPSGFFAPRGCSIVLTAQRRIVHHLLMQANFPSMGLVETFRRNRASLLRVLALAVAIALLGSCATKSPQPVQLSRADSKSMPSQVQLCYTFSPATPPIGIPGGVITKTIRVTANREAGSGITVNPGPWTLKLTCTSGSKVFSNTAIYFFDTGPTYPKSSIGDPISVSVTIPPACPGSYTCRVETAASFSNAPTVLVAGENCP